MGGSFLEGKKLGRFLAPFVTKKGAFQIQPITNTVVLLLLPPLKHRSVNASRTSFFLPFSLKNGPAPPGSRKK